MDLKQNDSGMESLVNMLPTLAALLPILANSEMARNFIDTDNPNVEKMLNALPALAPVLPGLMANLTQNGGNIDWNQQIQQLLPALASLTTTNTDDQLSLRKSKSSSRRSSLRSSKPSSSRGAGSNIDAESLKTQLMQVLPGLLAAAEAMKSLNVTNTANAANATTTTKPAIADEGETKTEVNDI